MMELDLYVVHYIAVQVGAQGVVIRHGDHTIAAVAESQAINSMTLRVEDEFPREKGWQLDVKASRICRRLIRLAAEEWGWIPKGTL